MIEGENTENACIAVLGKVRSSKAKGYNHSLCKEETRSTSEHMEAGQCMPDVLWSCPTELVRACTVDIKSVDGRGFLLGRKEPGM